MLSTHYLAIRLPAEITLPHRDYPLPTIFPLQSSHKYTNVPFPNTTPTSSQNTSPAASRFNESSNVPKVRPLFINKPLPILGTGDPASYSAFIEGVSHLAYDIAWVCKSQGIPVGDEGSFDDICNIGKNLYNLLIGPEPRPGPSSSNNSSRASSNHSTPTKGSRRDGESEVEDKRSAAAASSAPFIGRYSHGSAHSHLGSAEGLDFIRSWKLLSPVKISDRLKSLLTSEAANAEWELLDEDAWAVENNEELAVDDGVVVGAIRERRRRGSDAGMQSFMSMRTVVEAVEVVGGEGDRRPGSNGWTKLKPR